MTTSRLLVYPPASCLLAFGIHQRAALFSPIDRYPETRFDSHHSQTLTTTPTSLPGLTYKSSGGFFFFSFFLLVFSSKINQPQAKPEFESQVGI